MMNFKKYFAKSPDGLKKKIIRVSSMDEYLNKGWGIYECNVDDTEERLIADPKNGYLREKPNPVRSYTMTVRAEL